jgi:hypothetical protein
MADEATKDAAVQVGGAYVENEYHVPNPLDDYGTFNTEGVGAHHDPSTVSPIFDADRAQVAKQVKAALDPEDATVPETRVQFAGEGAPDQETQRKLLLGRAEARLEEPVVLGDPVVSGREAAAAAEGQEGVVAATNQDAENAAANSTGGARAGQHDPNTSTEGAGDKKATTPAKGASKS